MTGSNTQPHRRAMHGTRPQRVVEPDLRRGAGTPSVPGVRTSLTGVLLVGALVVGGAATVSGAAPAAASCDIRASQARLTDARHLLTAVRLSYSTDPRQVALARDLHVLGVTPAVSTGWRQQAVDVSDRLLGTTDPTLRQVAVTLARSGVGPTPADLLGDDPPDPVQELLNSADQPLDAVGSAVAAAGQAAGALPPRPASGPSTPSTTTGGGLPQRPGTDPPRACSDTGDGAGSTGSDGPTPVAPSSTAVDPAPSSASQTTTGTPRSADSDDSGLSTTSDAPDESGTTLTPGIDPDRSSPTPDIARPSIMTSTGTGTPVAPGDLGGAADVLRAVADLLQTLSVQSTPDASRLAGQLRELLGHSPTVGRDTSTSPVTPSDLDQSVPPSTTTQLPRSRASTSADPPDTGQTAAPSSSDGDGPAGGWESQAHELADQARQAAGTDPLARELASKLAAAGFGGNGTMTSTGESRPGTEDSAAPTRTSSDSTTFSPTPSPSDGSIVDRPDPGPADVDGGHASPADGDVSPATWDRLAECESSGDWAADTGNGFSGGLQFDPATWDAFGGQDSPADASRAEQVAVAQKVKDAQGWSAWPACSAMLGLR